MLKMEAWRLKWSLRGSIDQWSQIPITWMRSRIRIRVRVKSLFRIRVEVMQCTLCQEIRFLWLRFSCQNSVFYGSRDTSCHFFFLYGFGLVLMRSIDFFLYCIFISPISVPYRYRVAIPTCRTST
jgi:hypothetical protein